MSGFFDTVLEMYRQFMFPAVLLYFGLVIPQLAHGRIGFEFYTVQIYATFSGTAGTSRGSE